MIPFIWYSGKGKNCRDQEYISYPKRKKKKSVISRGRALGNSLTAKGQHEGGFWWEGSHDRTILCLDCGDGYMTSRTMYPQK